MDRRGFLTAGAAIAASAAIPTSAWGANPASRKRLAMTTTSIRDRIPMRVGPGGAAGKMSLIDAPAFLRDQIGLTNLEVWNLQFEDLSIDYCRRLRSAADKARVKICNIQVEDITGDLASAADAMRAKSVEGSKAWVDRAVALGSPSIRLNLGSLSPNGPFNQAAAVASFKELAEYGRQRRVLIVTENHFGPSLVIENIINTLKAVNHPNFRTIVDWGNVPGGGARGTQGVIDLVKQMRPWLHLVSAKGANFDANYTCTDYDIAAITRATEAMGFKGIYSVEIFGPTPPGFDPVRAVNSVKESIVSGLRKA